MVLGSADSERQHALREQDPMQVAVFPLAVPYLPVNDRLKPNSMLVTERSSAFCRPRWQCTSSSMDWPASASFTFHH